MKCIICNKKIDWDKFYGHDTTTCVCHNCFSIMADNCENQFQAIEIICNVGKEIAELRKQLIELKYGQKKGSDFR